MFYIVSSGKLNSTIIYILAYVAKFSISKLTMRVNIEMYAHHYFRYRSDTVDDGQKLKRTKNDVM